jgi:hypothetical protein
MKINRIRQINQTVKKIYIYTSCILCGIPTHHSLNRVQYTDKAKPWPRIHERPCPVWRGNLIGFSSYQTSKDEEIWHQLFPQYLVMMGECKNRPHHENN